MTLVADTGGRFKKEVIVLCTVVLGPDGYLTSCCDCFTILSYSVVCFLPLATKQLALSIS